MLLRPLNEMHRHLLVLSQGVYKLQLLLLLLFLSFSNKVIPQLDKTLGRTGQTLRACTAAEAF